MAFNLNNALGIHEHALVLRSQRAAVLAANMANADTPHYKARDFDFRHVLQQVTQGQRNDNVRSTRRGHFGNSHYDIAPSLQYRTATQPSLDGNTVDVHAEQVAFSQNALNYQVTLRFLNGKIKGLMSAIRGE